MKLETALKVIEEIETDNAPNVMGEESPTARWALYNEDGRNWKLVADVYGRGGSEADDAIVYKYEFPVGQEVTYDDARTAYLVWLEAEVL